MMKFLTLCALFGINQSKALYDMHHSDVQVYSKLNFDHQVTNQRDKGISVVHFYKESDGKSEAMSKEFT